MDVTRFEVLLRKINSLKQNIDLSGEHISKLEIELLKTYIKQLYETVDSGDPAWVEKPEPDPEPKKKQKDPEEQVPVESGEVEKPEMEEKPKPKNELEPEKSVEEKPKAEEVKPVFDKELLAIFDSAGGSELSDKLSATPISDLSKAFGLNDKIFTINELFGGDNALYNDTIRALNALEHFDQARDYLLLHIAGKYDWAGKDNLKKAQRFIKVIKRRYNNQ